MMAKVSTQQRALDRLSRQIKDGMAHNDITVTAMAAACGVSRQWFGKLMAHPEKMTLAQWQTVNGYLHLDPANFNTAAGFVRDGFGK